MAKKTSKDTASNHRVFIVNGSRQRYTTRQEADAVAERIHRKTGAIVEIREAKRKP